MYNIGPKLHLLFNQIPGLSSKLFIINHDYTMANNFVCIFDPQVSPTLSLKIFMTITSMALNF